MSRSAPSTSSRSNSRPSRRAFLGQVVLGAIGLSLLVHGVPSCTEDFPVRANLLEHRCVVTRSFQWYDHGVLRRSLVDVVQSEGDGEHFDVELLELDGRRRSQITDPAELETFDGMQASLEAGGGYRAMLQVILRITHRGLLEDNYDLQLEGSGDRSAIPGEPSVVYLAVPKGNRGSGTCYRWILSAAAGREGLLLGYDHFELDGSGQEVLLESMRLTTLDYGQCPDIDAHRRAQKDRRSFRSLEALVDDAAQNDVPIFLPRDLPRGYRPTLLERVSLQSDATQSGQAEFVKVYRVVLSDGADWIELQHSPPTAFSRGLFGDDAGPSRQTEVFVHRSEFYGVFRAAVPQPGFEVTIEAKDLDRVMRTLRHLHQAVLD